MKVTAIIERSKDGLYSIYTEEETGNIGLHGFGDTPEEAIKDFWEAYEEMKELCDVPKIDVTFKNDF